MKNNHMIQYAFVGTNHHTVYHTEELTDDEVKAKVLFASPHDRVYRIDRCPECEAWTTSMGRLRIEMDTCPAIVAAIASRTWLAWRSELDKARSINSERHKASEYRCDYFGNTTTVPMGLVCDGEFSKNYRDNLESFLDECFRYGLSPEDTIVKSTSIPYWMF